jgi:hypoxanthine phosphoribosyltransferase
MERLFGKPIITQEQMKARIRELGRQISADYAGKDLVLIGVLKGAYAFYADLARAIRIPIRVDFLIVATPAGHGRTLKRPRVVADLTETIKGKDVLLVEDIVDSGVTAQRLLVSLARKKPRSINICTLLNKQENRTVDVPLAYVGFTVPNQYIVGYGVDFQQRYRNLPYLAVLEQKDLEKKG